MVGAVCVDLLIAISILSQAPFLMCMYMHACVHQPWGRPLQAAFNAVDPAEDRILACLLLINEW